MGKAEAALERARDAAVICGACAGSGIYDTLTVAQGLGGRYRLAFPTAFKAVLFSFQSFVGRERGDSWPAVVYAEAEALLVEGWRDDCP